MALDYELYFNNDTTKVDVIGILGSEKVESQEFPNENTSVYSYYENYGFIISIRPDEKTKVQIKKKSYSFNSTISFRINKFKMLEGIDNMHNLIFEILGKLKTDMILVFNGESIILVNDKSLGLTLNSEPNLFSEESLIKIKYFNPKFDTFSIDDFETL